MNEKQKQRVLASSLGRMGSALLKTVHVNVAWLFKDDLGYTSIGSKTSCTVNVAWQNERYIDPLSEEEKDAMRMGLFAHELLHQLLTNFEYIHKVTESMTRAEASIFMLIVNTIEDPAIEYFAPSCFGGKLLDALRFMTKRVYQMCIGIENSSDAFMQLINAMVHFGNMGIVKGEWTFPEAKEMFKKVVPIYNEAIECPDSEKRLDYAVKCMEITRPLWERQVQEQEFIEKLLEELSRYLQQQGLHILKDSEKDLKVPDNAVSEKRNAAAVKILKSSEDETSKDEDSEQNGDAQDDAEQSEAEQGDAEKDEPKQGTTEKCDFKQSDEKQDDAERDAGKSSISEDENAESESEQHNASVQEENESEAEQQNMPGQEETASNDEQQNMSSQKDSEQIGSEQKGSDCIPESDEEQGDTSDPLDDITMGEDEANSEAEKNSYEISDELLERIDESLKEEEERLSKQDKEAVKEAKNEMPDIDINGKFRGKATCLNQRIADYTAVNEAIIAQKYNMAKANYQNDIKLLTKTLKRLFESDREECFASTSGEYNIIRGSLNTSARVFDKRRDPAKLKNAAVMLLVDLSGSMGGEKEQQARRTAITMAESLTACNIPYYIMGFHADRGGYDAVHDHFVTWSNRKSERETLITMDAHGNNFDGYSIRYAAEMLKKRTEDNRILFVISDGQPSSNKYRKHDGIADTIDAIKQSRKSMTVFGIGLGTSCGPEILHNMYGKDFIFVSDEKMLINMLGKKLLKCLAKR